MSKKCAGSPPEWTHIPQAALTRLGEVHAAWKTAYTIGPHTPVETEAKNEARDDAEDVIRPFVDQYLRYPPVTKEDRKAIGIPEHDGAHTPVPKPDTQPEADVAYPGVHRVELNHFRTVSAKEDDPRSEFGVRIFWGVLDPAAEHDKSHISAPPVVGDDLPHSTFTHRRRFRFDFEGDSEKTVYFFCATRTRRGVRKGKDPSGRFFRRLFLEPEERRIFNHNESEVRRTSGSRTRRTQRKEELGMRSDYLQYR